jgi:hypothetical protein
MTIITRARRHKFTQSDRETIISMHKAGETMETIMIAVERPMGSIATLVRSLIAQGILQPRIKSSGPRGKRTTAEVPSA